MKKFILALIVLSISAPLMAQEEAAKEKTKKEKKSKKKTRLGLTNALVIGQLDNAQDRYTLEMNLSELFVSNGVKTVPSLNIMKLGSDAILLASDSIAQQMSAKGIDTYALVSVRGYDRRYKVSKKQDNLRTALEAASLFDLYRLDIVSISFEFKFFRNGEFVYGDMIKCGNVSDRATVLKRLRSKVEKRLKKKWRKK